MRSQTRGAAVAVLVLAATGGAGGLGGSAWANHPADAGELGAPAAPVGGAAVEDPATGGRFSDPFQEPTIAGRLEGSTCITDSQNVTICKPAAGSVTLLENGKVLYWNALEGTERIQATILAEYGEVALNDQSRTLDLFSADSPKWGFPQVNDGGANPGGYEPEPLIPGLVQNEESSNDGALFCSDLSFLPDGRVLATGGTAYYSEPGVPGTNVGLTELEGLRNARIYDPETDRWEQTGSMNRGRWYPTVVGLENGDQFVASGVQKLLKPIYPTHPEDSLTNVTQTETYDVETGKWTDNGRTAQYSMPLYPRLHLLPNGNVLFNTNGQAFNPFGQSYDEFGWNFAATYNPKAKTWRRLGVPGLEASGIDPSQIGPDTLAGAVRDVTKLGIPGGGKAATLPGFRGSTFSVMLPLKPGEDGSYRQADILTAGGVLNPPSPGSYLPTSDSRITRFTTSGSSERMETRPTGDLNQPRWYTQGTLLPTGEVLATSGGTRDHVVLPGTEQPVQQAELFDPATETWKPLASGKRPRTYHNTALLLQDGRVLIGGHAPLTTLYLRHVTLPGGFAPNRRDPTFEIYEPPYLFRGERPVISSVAGEARYGATMDVTVNGSADDVASVVLVRNGTVTHVVDADQRNVELRVVRRSGSTVTVQVPAEQAVAPPGPYLLFVNRSTDKGLVPSVAKQVRVG